MRKKVLQKHQVAAFNKTLFAVEAELLKRIQFIEQWNDVYKFPVSVSRENLRRYKAQLKAIDKLKNFKQ